MRGKDDARARGRYALLVERFAPRSEMGVGLFRAFWVGGTICAIGQVIMDLYTNWLQLGMQAASTATSITLVFL